jgi:hypothetical protein
LLQLIKCQFLTVRVTRAKYQFLTVLVTRAKYKFLTVCAKFARVASGSDMGARTGALPPARPPVRGGTRRLLRHGRPQVRTAEIKYEIGHSHQGVTKRCLSWLTNSTFVYEPKWGWGLRGLSQWVQLYTGTLINFGDLTPH